MAPPSKRVPLPYCLGSFSQGRGKGTWIRRKPSAAQAASKRVKTPFSPRRIRVRRVRSISKDQLLSRRTPRLGGEFSVRMPERSCGNDRISKELWPPQEKISKPWRRKWRSSPSRFATTPFRRKCWPRRDGISPIPSRALSEPMTRRRLKRSENTRSPKAAAPMRRS